jgi:hypothetical protein
MLTVIGYYRLFWFVKQFEKSFTGVKPAVWLAQELKKRTARPALDVCVISCGPA